MNIKKSNRLIGVFLLVFLIHDIEEILTVEDFIFKHSDIIPYKITTLEFAFAFFLLWIITFIGCVKALKKRRFLGMEPITFFSLLVTGIFLANGIGHLLQFIFFRDYVPGIITTILILFPYCLITLKFLLNERLITINKFFIFLFLGFVLQIPFALASILIAKVVLKLISISSTTF